MQPRLVTEIRDPQGRVDQDVPARGRTGGRSRESTAADHAAMMVNVVTSGTGTAAQIPGVIGGGQDGDRTARRAGTAPHAWFVCFAPAGPDEVPTIAVAVIVLDGGRPGSEATGGRVAAPIAKQVIEAYLRETTG